MSSSEIHPAFNLELTTFSSLHLHIWMASCPASPSPKPPQHPAPRILRVIAWASARAASSQRHASTWPCCAERCSAVLRSSPLVESSNDAALPLVAKVTLKTGQETLRFTRFHQVSTWHNEETQAINIC